MTRWMDSAQAHYKRQEYEQQHPQPTPAGPTTEAEALKEYKALHIVMPETHRREIRELEALAEQNGWEALSTYQTQRQARREAEQQVHAARQQKAVETAAQLSTVNDAIALLHRATAAGDKILADAITKTAAQKGWNMNLKNLADYTADLHNQFADIISGHDALSREWRDPLSSKHVTPGYVKEQTSAETQARKAKLDAILNEANGFVADAQADYDRAYAALTATDGDTNEQLLAEMRATKTWERMQRELTNVDPTSLTDELTRRVATADPNTLRTLIEEMPSFLTGRGIRDADAVVKAAVSARPELADAKARISEAARVQAVVMHDTQHISARLNDITAQDVTPDTWVAYVNPDTAIRGGSHA